MAQKVSSPFYSFVILFEFLFFPQSSPASVNHSRFCTYWEVPNAAFAVMEDKHGNPHTQRQSATEVQTVSLYMQGNEAQEKKNVFELPMNEGKTA